MNTSRRQRVDALFEAAMDLPTAAQAEFLDARCGGDEGLRNEVAELLRLARESLPGLDLDSPSNAFKEAAMKRVRRAPSGSASAAGRKRLTSKVDAEAGIGERIGRWRVIREIGRGGMGAVHLVERVGVEFQLRGALKLVEGAGPLDEVYRRFDRERRILASLSHPHIAQLLDGGRAADGRPYLVMEYVDGRPIDRYCDEERLTIDERLAMFARVCAAVQHAHRQLVVHRDVKPSNIIVTADGHPMLLDFGIARLLPSHVDPDEHDAMAADGGMESAARAAARAAARTAARRAARDAAGAATGPAVRVLTPDYASPEQVRGEAVAIASDVYQLGLLLYELLTGARAQSIGSAAATPGALERLVCETEPVRPSVRARDMSIESCAARRTTPAALSRALRGDLDTLVQCALRKDPARRYGSIDELLEDVERYRQGSPLRARADNPAYRARKFMGRHPVGIAWTCAAAVVLIAILVVFINARVRASRERAEARQMETLLGELFSVPNRALTGRPVTPLDYVRKALDVTRRQLVDQPESQARLLTVLGRTSTVMGDYELSNRVLSDALTLRIATTGPESIETAEALKMLATSQHYLGRYEEAEANLRRALMLRRNLLGADHGLTMEARLELGDLLHTRGNLVDAEAHLREAVAMLRGRPGRADELARGLRDLGNVLRDRGVMEGADAAYREALGIFNTLHGEGHVLVAEGNTYFGRLLVRRGQLDEAEARLNQSLRSLRHMFGGDHPLTGSALRELGFLRIEQGRYPEAERLLADAQQVFRTWLGEEHPMVPRARAHQAELALRRGDLREAVRLATLTLEQFDRLNLADHPSAIDAQLTLGQALVALRQFAAAERELAAGLVRARQQLSPADPRLSRFEQGLATAGADKQ